MERRATHRSAICCLRSIIASLYISSRSWRETARQYQGHEEIDEIGQRCLLGSSAPVGNILDSGEKILVPLLEKALDFLPGFAIRQVGHGYGN